MNLKKLTTLLLLVISAVGLFAQRTITGKVTDHKEALIGATVLVKGVGKGTVTDANGAYSVELPGANGTLVFSYVGYASKEVAVGTSTTIDVELGTGLELENIVVIGSRNASRTKLETPVPVDVIPLANVVNEVGQVDLNQILTYVAPSFQSSRQTVADGTDHIDPAQLRGLGPDQVLVLINGKRRHQSALVNVNGTVNRGTVGTDLAAIPAASIERVEILRDGAAAQYGSDAIAGVINIVLKKTTGLLNVNVSGGEYITTYPKNYALYTLPTINGVANPNLGKDPNVKVTDGGTVQLSANYGIKLNDKGYINFTGEYINRAATNRTGTYAGQIYNKNGAKQIVDDSIMQARGLTRNSFDMAVGQSAIKSGGVIYNGAYQLGGGWELYSFGQYNNKHGKAAGLYRFPTGGSSSPIPASVYALPNFPYQNGFLPYINSNITDISAAVGLRGKWNGWDVDLSNAYGKNTFDFSVTNSINYSQAFTQIQTEFDAGGLNFSQNTVNLDFSRNYPVLGGLNVAFGGEYRIDQFGITAGETNSWQNADVTKNVAAGAQVFPGFRPSNAGSFSRNNEAVYLDLEQDFSKSFLVEGALRFENYSDFGSTVNYKIASRYKISDNFTLRGSVSTGFRAPSMQQKYYAKTNTLFISQNGALVPAESGTFTNVSPLAQILGIPTLKEETSQNYTIGATARFGGNFDLSVDYYQINIFNRIVLTNNFSGTAGSAIDSILKANGATTANFFTNAIDTKSNGVEAVLNYHTRFSDNQDFRAVLAATFINNEVVKGSDGKALIHASDILIKNNQLGNYFSREDQARIEVENPANKASLTLNYKIGDFGVMLRETYFGKVIYLDPSINPNDPATFPVNSYTGAKETLDQEFSPKGVTDLTLNYQILKQLNVSIGGNNIFDNYQDAHTNYANTSFGRFIYSRRVEQMGFAGAYWFARLRFDLK